MLTRLLIIGVLLLIVLRPGLADAARQTNGTNQSMQSASAVSLGNATLLSMSFWLYWDSFANDDHLALESQLYTTGANSDMVFQVNPNASSFGGNKFTVSDRGGGGNSLVSFARPSAATWHHYLITFDIAQSQDVTHVYIDGVDQSLTSEDAQTNTGGFSTTRTINLMSRDNASLFGAGRIAEVAVWTGVNLSGANATSLTGGVLPTSISPGAGTLVNYWKICGTASPEPATIGSVNMTVTGATQIAHPSAVSASCTTTTYYLDSAVGSSGNGLSWATAWKNWSDITGLSPGDTVNISGGSVSQTYNVGQYSGPSGTSVNPITYQVSTEAGHNGMVYINFTTSPPPYQWIYADPVGVNYNQWITISGNVNGVSHMTVTAPLLLFGDNSQGITLRYITTSGLVRAYDSDTMELDHMVFNIPNGSDYGVQGIGRAAGVKGYPANSYTRNSIHDSTFNIIADNDGSGNGDDGIQNVGNISIYNNRFIGVDVPVYAGVQHQDGIQTRGPRVKIYNNYFENIWNYPVYGDIRDNGEPESFQVFNNIFYNNHSQNVSIGCGGIASNIDDIKVFNNTFVNSGQGVSLGQGQAGCTVTNGYIVNNLFYNTLTSTINAVGGVTISNNTDGTTANITFSDPASNWHIQNGSTAVIDQGISPSYLTSITSLDYDGRTRPTGANWDIGAYELFGTPPPATPTNHHVASFTGPTWAILIWQQVTDASLTGYAIYRSTVSGTYGAPIKTITAASAAAARSPMTQFYDASLLKAGTYYYKIASYDGNGNFSPLTSELSVTVTGKQ